MEFEPAFALPAALWFSFGMSESFAPSPLLRVVPALVALSFGAAALDWLGGFEAVCVAFLVVGGPPPVPVIDPPLALLLPAEDCETRLGVNG